MEDFLGNSWRKLHREQTQTVGLEELGKEAKIYEDLKSCIKNLPDSLSEQTREDIEDNFQALQESIAHYIQTVFAFNKTNEETPKDVMLRLDESRSFAHNALIDQLNILARLMKNSELDTSWRDMIGYNRTDIQKWAQEVDRHVNIKEGEN